MDTLVASGRGARTGESRGGERRRRLGWGEVEVLDRGQKGEKEARAAAGFSGSPEKSYGGCAWQSLVRCWLGGVRGWGSSGSRSRFSGSKLVVGRRGETGRAVRRPEAALESEDPVRRAARSRVAGPAEGLLPEGRRAALSVPEGPLPVARVPMAVRRRVARRAAEVPGRGVRASAASLTGTTPLRTWLCSLRP